MVVGCHERIEIMIPVNQTICNFQNGDCFRACVASVLGAPIESVPNFMKDGEAGFEQRVDVFTTATGILLFDIDVSGNNKEFLESLYAVLRDVYLIATGKSARDNSKLHVNPPANIKKHKRRDDNDKTPNTYLQYLTKIRSQVQRVLHFLHPNLQ